MANRNSLGEMEPTPIVDLETQVMSLATSLGKHRTDTNDLAHVAEELKALELLHRIRQSSHKRKGGPENESALLDRIMKMNEDNPL